MYRKRHGIYRVQHHSQFQASTEGLIMYPPQIRMDFYDQTQEAHFRGRADGVYRCIRAEMKGEESRMNSRF